ncbi:MULTISPECIES: hypothetical protein [Ehrlichia]|uniref:Uncharacterized protein n=1 Tax=Ehrlichia cf. muris str. EmCRT TaxID=1359167 RepID=A0A0F3NG93_9RICK|nr:MULTISPECIES: hypothetical protein [Ehrlichia]KJV65924.1 hypothetical protein EMUCRT_0106 [Ehrlichia cf. muris str. EmCRT]OUC04837.1 hypothetical protein DB91_01470 [Ehrlichia sp. Wisconsin_h]
MITKVQHRSVINNTNLKKYVTDITLEKIDEALIDISNVIPLCTALTLDTEPDFTSFKQKVTSMLQEYKEWFTTNDKVNMPLIDERTSDTLWNSIQEIHTLYHKHQMSVSSDNGINLLDRIAYNSSHNKKDITINNNLKYNIQYTILTSFIDQCLNNNINYHTSYTNEILSKTFTIRNKIINQLKATLFQYVQKKAFFSYAKYLQNLYNIQASYVIERDIDLLRTTKQFIGLKAIHIVNQKIFRNLNPLLDNGCEINIKCDIPRYTEIFLEISDITISGTVYGSIFNKYGSIIITNAKEECSKNIISIFGTVSINGRIMQKKLPDTFTIPPNFCSNIKDKSIITKQTDLCQAEKLITSFHSWDVINQQDEDGIHALNIELFHPKLQYHAVIVSIGWPINQHNIATTENAESLFCNTMHNANHLNIIDDISQDRKLPCTFFDHSIPMFIYNIRIENKQLIIENFSNKIALYLTYITHNGTNLISKFGVHEVVIHSKSVEFSVLILHDTDVTIFGKFCGVLYTNKGNITIIGQVNKSRIMSNTGLIKIQNNPTNSKTPIAIDSAIIAQYGAVEFTGQYANSYIDSKNITQKPLGTTNAHSPSSYLTRLSEMFCAFISGERRH